MTVNGVPIEITIKDDGGDIDEVAAISRDLSSRNNTLLVVGHGYSSTSKVALREYLRAEPRIPVVLVRETNPELLPSICDDPEISCPVIRLSPTDEDQAKTAVSFAIHKPTTSFAVIRDSDNPVYSGYLANRIIAELHANKKSVIVSTVDTMVAPMDTFKSLGVDCIFFVGEYNKALILIHQADEVYGQDGKKALPIFILSDWAADTGFPKVFMSDNDNVFLTHPRSADEISDFGYKRYGHDTAWIIERLIMQTDQVVGDRSNLGAVFRKFLGLRHIEAIRAALGDVMVNIDTFKWSPSQTDYSFDRRGRLSTGDFHIWQIVEGKYLRVVYD